MLKNIFVLLCLSALLAGCGGGGSSAGDGSGSSTTPPSSIQLPTIGAAGGTVSGPNGSLAIVPPGAIDTPTTIRVAKDATGAPALPAGLVTAGDMYAITPHGTTFAQPVEVRIPLPAVTLQPNQEFKIAKAE